MALSLETLALARGYTDETVVGGGAIKGKNCTITDISPIEGGNRITFQWTLDDGTIRTDTLDVMNGAQGEKGEKGDKGDKGDPGSGGGAVEHDIVTNLTVGNIQSGTTIEEGTTLTEFLEKLLITEIAPTTTFTASGSGVKEVGTSVTPTLTLNITGKGTGTPTAIKFYSGSTLLDTQAYMDGTNSYSYTMENAVTTNTTVKGVLEYTKSSGTSATIEKSASYTFVLASYYGAVTTAPTTLGEIQALTKNVKNTKALTATFALNNQRSCYCYPSSFGNLTSIKDANNFEYISSYTKTTVGDYVVYTLTDPVTASGFKQVYA